LVNNLERERLKAFVPKALALAVKRKGLDFSNAVQLPLLNDKQVNFSGAKNSYHFNVDIPIS